jgi:hypothetical protein
MTEVAAKRRAELLQIARRSRIKWVLEEKEVEHHNVEKKVHEHSEGVPPALAAKIPAAESIQNVLNFLTMLINDGEVCDVASIAAGIIDYDDYDEEQYTFLAHGSRGKPDSYNEFIGKLILPASTELVKSMQQFVTKFYADFQAAQSTPLPVDKLPEPEEEELQSWPTRIWAFLDHVYKEMRELPVWAHDSPQQFDATKVHCEKFLFCKLYPLLFGSDPEDRTLNERTHERIESLAFLTAEHLDIKCAHALYVQYMKRRNEAPKEYLQARDYDFLTEVLEQPMTFLREMETARSPQDKLMCVKRCTMAIAQLLKSCRQDGSLPGADELVPMMIYVVKCCNPRNLHSNLKYLQRYTRPSQMIAEAGYLLTNFVSGVFFLDNVDAKALTIEPEEFDRAILQSKMKAKAANDKALAAQQKSMQNHAQQERAAAERNRSRNNSLALESEQEVTVEALLSDYKKAVNINNRTDAVSAVEVHRRRRAGGAAKLT